MKTNIFLFLSILSLASCGKLAEKFVNLDGADSPPPNAVVTTNQGPYTPGQYFKIMKDVGTDKDFRIYELNYKSDGSFEHWQKSYPKGNFASGFFHKTTGTFKEETLGLIVHTVLTDTCSDLSSHTASALGDPADIIRVRYKSSTIDLYSAITWSVPPSISSVAGPVVEDIGCKLFN